MRSIEQLRKWAVLSQQVGAGITSSSAMWEPSTTSIQALGPYHAFVPNSLSPFASFTFLVYVCLNALVWSGIHMYLWYACRGQRTSSAVIPQPQFKLVMGIESSTSLELAKWVKMSGQQVRESHPSPAP